MGTPAHEGTTPTPRAGLVAAGALVVAVALLQIAQGAISAFSPRPVIQAALVVGVGLAALAAELVRSGAARGFVWGAAAGCVIALGTGLGVALASGFSPADPEPVGAQVAKARKGLLRPGTTIAAFRRAQLHEGADSFVFVTRSRSGDAVRIFDAEGGTLRPALTLAPTLRDQGRPLPARFHLVALRDLDGDGQPEILGSFDTNQAGEELQRVPVLIGFAGSRYRVSPLLAPASVRRALPTYRLAAVPHVPATTSGWVSGLAIDTGHAFLPDGVTLAATTIPGGVPALELPVLPKGAGFPTFVRFWRLDGTRLRALCLRGARGRLQLSSASPGPGRFLDLPAARSRLADAMTARGVFLGELVQGRCLESGS